MLPETRYARSGDANRRELQEHHHEVVRGSS
jgi:hypothetical protein